MGILLPSTLSIYVHQSCGLEDTRPTFFLSESKLLELAVKPNMHSVYVRAWDLFNHFLLLYTKDLNNLTEHELVEFIAFLLLTPMTGSTIRTYVSGVHHHLKIYLFNDFQSSFLAAPVLRGVTSPECQQDMHIPIPATMLQRMFDAALHVAASLYTGLLTQAILTLGFLAFYAWMRSLGHHTSTICRMSQYLQISYCGHTYW